MSLCDNLKKYRKNKGLTQKELASKSGLTRESIGNYERGDRIPNASALQAIAEALDIPVTHILGTTTPMPNGGTVYSAMPDEIKELYPQKKMTKEEIHKGRIKYLKEIHNKKPLDKYISNIYERYLSNTLTNKDIEDIDRHKKDEIGFEFLGEDEFVFCIYSYESDAYQSFKDMLKFMGYDIQKIDDIALFRMIKSQIQYTVYLNPPNKFDDK